MRYTRIILFIVASFLWSRKQIERIYSFLAQTIDFTKKLMNLILFPRALPGPPNHIFTASFRTFDGRGDEKRGIFPSNHSLSPSTYYQPTTIVMFTIGCSFFHFLPISLPPTFVCPESNSPAHSLASLRNPECFSSCNNFY